MAKKKMAVKPAAFRSFSKLLVACNLDDKADLSFVEMNFQLEPIAEDEEEWDVFEYHFSRRIFGIDAFEELEKLGYRLLGGVRRALEFIEVHPGLIEAHPLVATVQFYDEDNFGLAMPYFDADGVCIQSVEQNYSRTCGWLVLRKKSKA